MLTSKIDVFVNLIRDDEQLMFFNDWNPSFQLLLAINRSRRIAGRGENHHFRFGRNMRLEHFCGHFEIRADVCFNDNWNSTS